MKPVVLLAAALALAGPASAADREVLFGDAFRLDVADPAPFDRLADGRVACLSDVCADRTVEVGNVTIRVLPRVSPEQVKAAKPPYRAPTAVPAADDASRASGLLLAAGVLLGLVGVALGVSELRRPGAAPVDRLVRALRLVRESAARPAADRRRALDHLAATLGPVPPAEQATRLAWGRREPEPDATLAVAEEVAR